MKSILRLRELVKLDPKRMIKQLFDELLLYIIQYLFFKIMRYTIATYVVIETVKIEFLKT